MVESPKTSFIPKQSLRNIPGRVPHSRKHFNIPGFIGMVVFLCGMILAVGVFLYKDVSVRNLESKKQELQEIKNSFSQGDIEALRELDRRINVAHTLLNEHLSPSVIFDALELRTQRDVSFNEFSYERRESGSVELVLEGTALRFNTVALQSKQLADASVLARTVFSDLDIDEEGNVHFVATSEGNNSALTYSVAPALVPVEDQGMGTTTPSENMPSDPFDTGTQNSATTTEAMDAQPEAFNSGVGTETNNAL